MSNEKNPPEVILRPAQVSDKQVLVNGKPVYVPVTDPRHPDYARVGGTLDGSTYVNADGRIRNRDTKVTPFAVMSNDTFNLEDTNNDGVKDTVFVTQHVKPEDVSTKSQFESYHAYVRDRASEAVAANRGRPANDLAAAKAVAIAKAERDWKGPKPPVTPADLELQKKAADAKATKDAIKIELAKQAAEKA